MAFTGSPWHCGPDILRSPFDLPSFRHGRLSSFGNNAHHLLHDFFPPSSSSSSGSKSSSSSSPEPSLHVFQFVNRGGHSQNITSSLMFAPSLLASTPLKGDVVYSEGGLRACIGVGTSHTAPLSCSALYMPFHNPLSAHDLVSTSSASSRFVSQTTSTRDERSSSWFSWEELGTTAIFANVNLAPSGSVSSSSVTSSSESQEQQPFHTTPGVGVGVAIDSPYLTGFVHAMKTLPTPQGNNNSPSVHFTARAIFHVTENLHIGAEMGMGRSDNDHSTQSTSSANSPEESMRSRSASPQQSPRPAYTHGEEFDMDMLNLRLVYSGHTRNPTTFQPESYQACLSLEDRGRRVSLSYYRHTAQRVNSLPVSFWQNICYGVELCKLTQSHPIQDVSHFILVGGGLYQIDADRVVKGRIDSNGNLDIALGYRFWAHEGFFLPVSCLFTFSLNLLTALPAFGFSLVWGDERKWRRNNSPFNQLSYQ